MEVDVVINGHPVENAAIPNEHQRDHKVDRPTLSKNKKYHVFFCYRDVPNDKMWVKETVKKLENDFGFICCDHERDFLAGTKVISNIKYGIKNSEKVVCVLSKEGLDSGYLGLETEMAHKESIDQKNNLLIPVLLDDCEIPEELKLLTYIDARKEISETTWWPKLIAAIESKAEYSFFKGRREEEKKDKSENQPTYPFQKLCSLETTFICTQCSVQSTSKYIPKELASMDGVVHVETIKNIKRDLLDAPRIKCHQKCSWFCLGLLFFYVVTCIFIVLFDIILIIICTRVKNSRDENCIGFISIYVLCEIALGICVGVGFKYYYKVPRSIDQKIAEYNSELIKNGILITLVCTRKWRKASIVFYKASVDTCKQYIICHLRGVKKTERETLVNISETEAQTCADDIPILTRSGNEDLVQDTQTHHCGHDTLVDTSEMQENQIADDVPLLDLADNDQLDQLTEPLHRGHHMRLEKETVVNTSEMQENHIAEDLPLLNLSEQDQLDQSTENEAMKLLLMNAHEYLRQVFNGKMKNPKEDRHIPDCTCLCQYIEKTNKKFRKLVDQNKIIHAKNASIENNTKEILDAFRL